MNGATPQHIAEYHSRTILTNHHLSGISSHIHMYLHIISISYQLSFINTILSTSISSHGLKLLFTSISSHGLKQNTHHKNDELIIHQQNLLQLGARGATPRSHHANVVPTRRQVARAKAWMIGDRSLKPCTARINRPDISWNFMYPYYP